MQKVTPREQEILSYLVDGLSNQEIGSQLSIAPTTVKWHIRQLNVKFKTSNRSQLATVAKQWHLLDKRSAVVQHAPLNTTPFVGRDHDIQQICKVLEQDDLQLLNLLGPGGIGKSRLALEAVSRYIADTGQQAIFVALQGVYDEQQFLYTIAQTVGFPVDSPSPAALLDKLAHYLDAQNTILILDNMEQLQSAHAILLSILQQTSTVKIITTSRERLNLGIEHVYLVSGLRYPSMDEDTEIQEKVTYEAVQLFAQRAQRVHAEFSLHDELDSVIQICQQVEGMPLAIELSASWRNVLSCKSITQELAKGIEILETRVHDVPDRHKSIRAVFEQTWRHLAIAEQRLYKRLSVFQGSFSRSAAEEVAGASIFGLSSLVDKALIRLNTGGRYSMHELIKQDSYARLRENTEEHSEILNQHAQYFANFVSERLPQMIEGDQIKAAEEIRADLDNIYATIQFAFQTRSVSLITQLCTETMGLFFQFTSQYFEAYQLFKRTVEFLRPQASSQQTQIALTTALKIQSWFQLRLGLFDNLEDITQEAYTMYQTFDVITKPVYLSHPLSILAFLMLVRGETNRVIQIAEEMLANGQQHDLRTDIQFAHYLLAEAFLIQEKLEIAQHHASQAYQMSQRISDQWFSAYILNQLGKLAQLSNDFSKARYYFSESYDVRQPFHDAQGMALALIMLGEVELQEQKYEDAESYFSEALQFYQKIGDKGGLAELYKGLGLTAYQKGDATTAQDYLLSALDIASEIEYWSVLSKLFIVLSDLLWQASDSYISLMLLYFLTNHENNITKADYDSAQQNIQKLSGVVSKEILTSIISKSSELSLLEIVNVLKTPLQSSDIFQRNDADSLHKQSDTDALTSRELEVINLIAQGFTNAEIAEKLVIAIGTVKYYTSQIYSKLQVNGRIQAISAAKQQGFI